MASHPGSPFSTPKAGAPAPVRRYPALLLPGNSDSPALSSRPKRAPLRDSGPRFSTPSDGYRVEREQDGRVLFSYDVDGRTKVSMFAADGVRDCDGGEGWGVPAWAQCDPSELPPDVTDDLNIGVWEDDSGRRVPLTRIQSFQGAEHCTWTDITFLLIGREETADWYVRDTSGGDFSELLRTTFANEATLPEGATKWTPAHDADRPNAARVFTDRLTRSCTPARARSLPTATACASCCASPTTGPGSRRRR